MSEDLLTHLAAQLPHAPSERLCVAYSGGPDSTALLHALSALPEAHERGLRAVHVDHGLHAHSASWARHCQTFCEDHDIPFTSISVEVRRDDRGIEAAARDARYAALAVQLQPEECLITAHHRDDQAETALLKLLRGSGPQGLGGMRKRRTLGSGWLWRPLLDLPRASLLAHTREHGLETIEDPSNTSPELARSFLRTRVMPLLREHWPHAALAITHAAQLHRDAADYIEQQARHALASLRHSANDSLDAAGWLALHPALRAPVLELWLHGQGRSAPTHAQRHELERQVQNAASDRVPCVSWAGTQVHVWRGRLHAHMRLNDPAAGWTTPWHGESLPFPGGGALSAPEAPHAHALPPLKVRLGMKGVRLRPQGDPHTRELRDLFQQAAIPPWLRRHCPLIYDAQERLLAVADLWLTEEGATLFTSCERRPRWQRPG